MSDIHELASAFVDETVERLPNLATYLGIPGYDDRWDDLSVEGSEAVAAMESDQLARLRSLGELDGEWDRLARRVIAEELEGELMMFEAGEHLLDLRSVASPVQDLRETFDHMDKGTADGWQNVVTRLQALPGAVTRYVSRLEEGRAASKTVAQRQVRAAIKQSRHHAGDGSSLLALGDEARDAGMAEDLVAAVETAVDEGRRGYSELAGYLEGTYLPDAVERDAVGPERHAVYAKHFLGTDLDPIVTYEWGWDEVTRLRSRMEEVADDISPGASLAEAIEILQTDSERAAASPEEFRDLMQQRQEIALSELEGIHFDVPTAIRSVDVKLAPAGGPLGAYYVDPSEDFSRPGSIWWSLGDAQVVPLFNQVSTAYHEGFPGHHLQVGIQKTAGDRFTRYQRVIVWNSGTGEGWALYAEDLMEELGYLEKPDYVMGKLAGEMLRACRVVIDIGSHHDLPIPDGQPFHPGEPWTFDTGAEMLRVYAAEDADVAESEMNRYLGWPAQAIAYKVGQQAIRDLRDQERAKSGFDRKRFHARLLEIGSTGIDVLRDHMAAS
jgi:uncharacterized protein (DUF885 family)